MKSKKIIPIGTERRKYAQLGTAGLYLANIYPATPSKFTAKNIFIKILVFFEKCNFLTNLLEIRRVKIVITIKNTVANVKNFIRDYIFGLLIKVKL